MSVDETILELLDRIERKLDDALDDGRYRPGC